MHGRKKDTTEQSYNLQIQGLNELLKDVFDWPQYLPGLYMLLIVLPTRCRRSGLMSSALLFPLLARIAPFRFYSSFFFLRLEAIDVHDHA